jgi:DNA primase
LFGAKEEMPAALAQTRARIRRLQVKARVRELQQAQINKGGLDEPEAAQLRELLSLRFDDSDN